jgi:hypothetical protein
MIMVYYVLSHLVMKTIQIILHFFNIFKVLLLLSFYVFIINIYVVHRLAQAIYKS